MKISFNWLKDYITLDESPEKVSEWLTACGLEVEGIEKTESVKGGLKGLVIGEVLTCEKHPDADKLSLTTVSTGKEVLPIVCGAPNVAKGQKVVVATVGTTLHTTHGDSFEIKKAKIRGQVSEGMICAEDEIGLGVNHDGIMVLDPEAVVGSSAAGYFNIEEDHCIEIGLTPNRADAASHIGVARDLVAVLNHLHPEKYTKINLPDISTFQADNHNADIRIIVEDPQACPRYAGVCISGVKVEESPDWLKNRLRVIGLKPINNLVDITNYVLHETGQPLHAFDAAYIKGGKVVVKKSPANTPFITLDEEEIKLSGSDLMICNAEEPMCIGGILGGLHSGVTAETRDIFLESAYFNPGTIRRSSKYHGIKTDASFRFERGADPEITLYALKRAAMLIKEIAGGEISSEVMDVYPTPLKPARIDFRYEVADRLIGKKIERKVIRDILESLQIKVIEVRKDGLLLEIPPFKVDVTREADLVEEILRIYGYNNVEIPERLHSSIVSSPKPDKEKLQNIASDFLSSRGYVEIMNNSLTRASYYNDDQFDQNTVVRIINPLSQDLNTMRQTLFFGGLETIAWNQNRRINDIQIYEFGNIYFKEQSSVNEKPDLKKLAGYREQRVLSFFLTGNIKPESWYENDKPATLFDLKAQIITLVKRMNVNLSDARIEELRNQSFFDTGLRYTINGKVLIELGEVCDKYLKAFDLKQGVFYGTVNWEYLITLSNKMEIRFSEIPRFPEVRRDLALLIEKQVQFADIEKIATLQEKKLIKSVRLFDVYQDEKMSRNMKSYAVSFTLQDENKTLTDKEIDKVMDKVARALNKELNATIR
jgi:phenylalanyl-tRNA synthetase beta chain